MANPTALPADKLFQRCDPATLDFETTESLEGLDDAIGQARALDAVQFGVGIRRDGFNIFAMGPTAIGKHTMVRRILGERAAGEATPPDWCYVNNFDVPHKPCAISLPAGRGLVFRDDMATLVEELRSAIPAAFESEEYQGRVQELEDEFKERQEQAFHDLAEAANQEGVRLLRTPSGFAFAPVKDGEVIGPEEFMKLPEEEQEEIKARVAKLQERMQETLPAVLEEGKKSREKLKQLNREVTLAAVGHLIDALRERYGDHEKILAYLESVQKDVIENVDDFRRRKDEQQTGPFGIPLPGQQPPSFDRYHVNVVVDHAEAAGAPVVSEDHPTYQNLVGRVEHQAQMGALLTDFSLIKAGALLRANGGYLVLDARKVLMQPFAWEALKGAINTREVRIESLGQMLSLVTTVSLEPEPIPLDVKVALVGDRFLYYLLSRYDPEFSQLFKVVADFEERVERNAESNLLYARLIATVARNESLHHFDRAAAARAIEYCARMAEDAERLSTHMGSLVDLLREADYWARERGRDTVTVEDVQTAIDKRIYRVDRVRERIQEEIRRGTIMIDTDGERVGQINGLSVLMLGSYAFGQPSRITATARVGKGDVIDIERAVKLGGPTHSKGVMIISNFLADRYAKQRPLSLTASLAFEQSYGGVDGDSASVGEFCVLLSALADVPIKQSMAVTGSVNQHGMVQPIGGVNEKIEGFFDVCDVRGLTGGQGVVIPASNVKHLMLRGDVVEAAAAGRFHVYAVETVDEALELLTGLPAGEPDAEGVYPEGTVNRRVADRLTELFELKRKLAAESKNKTPLDGAVDDAGAPPDDGDEKPARPRKERRSS
jgi:predicted ATP-dependent protease